MSVSRKVLRKMKKVMGVIGTIPVLASCSSQISLAGPWDYIKKVMKKVDGFLFSKHEPYKYSFKVSPTPKGCPNIYICHSFSTYISRDKIDYYYYSVEGYLFVSASYLGNVTNECIFRGDEIEELKCWKDDSKIKNLVVGYGVKEIADNAFSGWGNLENIIILDSVTRVGEGAFSNCSNLKEVMFLNSGSCAYLRRPTLYSEVKRHLAVNEGRRKDFYDDMLDQFLPSNCVVCADAFKNCKNLEYLACERGCGVILDRQAFNGCGFFELLFAGQDRILIDGNKEFRK